MTVYVALGANLVIAVAKTVGGLVAASPALLSEAAHSVADSLNEVFLLASLKRSRKAPTSRHPSATARSASSGRCSRPSASSSWAGASPSSKGWRRWVRTGGVPRRLSDRPGRPRRRLRRRGRLLLRALAQVRAPPARRAAVCAPSCAPTTTRPCAPCSPRTPPPASAWSSPSPVSGCTWPRATCASRRGPRS
ncbi:cation transporter [Streptomyces sp. M19]